MSETLRLLEALIAMLIFAFGVLGLVGLMGSSVRVTNDARYRSEAANLAGAMIADMWTMTADEAKAQFGAGGANGHAVLQQAPPQDIRQRPTSDDLLILSALEGELGL